MNDQSLRVLMIEDSKVDTLFIIRELTKSGYNCFYERVETASSMRKAIQEKQWDIILCDYIKPDFNAPSAIALLKEVNIDIPIIVVSGNIGEETAVECMRLGAQDYIMKSNMSRLCPAIARELEEAKIRNREKHTEEKLRESEKQYRTFFNTSRDCVFITSIDGKFVDMNDAAVELFGYSSRDELMQIRIPDLYVKKEERTKIINTMMEKGYIKDYPVDMRRKDGGVINTLTTSNLRYDAKGKATALMGTIKDITDRIEKEKKLNDTVELLIKTRDQLIQKDKMAALGRMASGIAHEIRNPLEIIYMGLDYLENNILNDNPDIHESIEKIFNAVSRADNIIKNVLSFSRQSEYKITQIPLCPLLDNVLTLAELMIQKNGVSVRREYHDELLEVAGDHDMLEHVFLNLVNNAVDAMKDCKEKILTVRAYKQFVTEVGYKTGYRRADFFSIGDEMIVVEISDTGKGIPEEALPKIFEPFFTTKSANEGTGLGLSIVHMIMDRLSGTIDVESRENQGTTFFIKLQPKIKMTDTNEV